MVGTIIVAAAVIIFLPDILDGEKESYQAEFEAIPQAPAFEGAKEHKAFPQEKLANIPAEEISAEEAADELLTENSVELETELAKNSNEQTVVVVPIAEKPIETVESKPKKVEPKPTVSEEKEKLAWVIHLGSFKHQKNVDELMRKLKANGYTAFTQPIKTKKGMLTKVIVGPNLNKADLQKKLPDLKKLTKVQGRLARFSVTK